MSCRVPSCRAAAPRCALGPASVPGALFAASRQQCSTFRGRVHAHALHISAPIAKIRPSGGNVLVRMTDPVSVSEGGIKLVEQSQAKTTTGIIVSCGAEIDDNPLLRAGAHVLLNSYRMGAIVVEIEGTEHVLVPSQHIAATWAGAQSTASLDNLQPCQGRVLVQVEPASEKTGGGVLLPDQAKNKPCTGTVCAVGQTDEDDAVDAASLHPGTRVVFFKHAGERVSQENSQVLVVWLRDVLSAIEP